MHTHVHAYIRTYTHTHSLSLSLSLAGAPLLLFGVLVLTSRYNELQQHRVLPVAKWTTPLLKHTLAKQRGSWLDILENPDSGLYAWSW